MTIYWLLVALAVGFVAIYRNRSFAGWIILGLCINLGALIVLLLLPPVPKRFCPFCSRSIPPKANTCPLCQSGLAEISAQQLHWAEFVEEFKTLGPESQSSRWTALNEEQRWYLKSQYGLGPSSGMWSLSITQNPKTLALIVLAVAAVFLLSSVVQKPAPVEIEEPDEEVLYEFDQTDLQADLVSIFPSETDSETDYEIVGRNNEISQEGKSRLVIKVRLTGTLFPSERSVKETTVLAAKENCSGWDECEVFSYLPGMELNKNPFGKALFERSQLKDFQLDASVAPWLGLGEPLFSP